MHHHWLSVLCLSLALAAGAAPACDSYIYEHLPHGAHYRNARDFGARGDGTTDDTSAIQAAFDFNQGGGDGTNLTTTAALVYLPAGTYRISRTIVLWFANHLIGNALCPPTLLLAPATPGFSGQGGMRPMLTANLGFNISVAHHAWWVQGEGQGGHANDLFYTQVHHVRLQVGSGNAGAVGILWPVAQQTSLRDIAIDMSASGAIGIDFQGGAGYNVTYPFNATLGGGGTVEDIAIVGSAMGLRLAGSQWTYRNLSISGATQACIAATSMAWAHTIIAATLSHCPLALLASLVGQGSVLLLDSTLGPSLGARAAISVNGTQGGLYLQNVQLVGAGALPLYVVDSLLPLSSVTGGLVQAWGLGAAYVSGAPMGSAAALGAFLPLPDEAGARAAGLRFACSSSGSSSSANATLCGGSQGDASTGLAAAPGRPTFADLPLVSASAFGAVGDGKTDDTAALQRALGSGRPIFLPSGTYVVRDSLVMPCNGTLVGEGLAELALAAAAPGFGDPAALKPMLSTAPSLAAAPCYAHLADLMLTTLGAGNLGALLLNHTGSAGSGFWDVGMRLYGFAVGLKAQLGPAQPRDPVYAVDSGGGVFSNAWWWVADHNLSNHFPMSNSTPGCVQYCSAGQVHGVQVTTQGPLLLLGTNFEHSGVEEYNFTGASNVVGASIQTEGTVNSLLLNGVGAQGPVTLFGTVFGSGTGHGDNKTAVAHDSAGPCVAAGAGGGALDMSYRVLGSMQRLQPLLWVDDDFEVAGNLSQRWECLAVYKGCNDSSAPG